MTSLLRFAILVLVVPPTLVVAQPSGAGEFRLPSADEVGRAVGTLCAGEAQGATLGFAAREAGRPVESVVAKLSEPTDPALKSIFRGLKATVEDVYAYPSIGYFTMFFYRSRICFRERTELRQMPSIQSSVAGLLRCDRQHGTENSPALLACVSRVVSEL